MPEFIRLSACLLQAVNELVQLLQTFLTQLDEDVEIFLFHAKVAP
ncbi:MAG: hypothetical protein Q4A28_06175 [Brachymonas sp.]|nr:hypothetical protein [Brachymonas sp.]